MCKSTKSVLLAVFFLHNWILLYSGLFIINGIQMNENELKKITYTITIDPTPQTSKPKTDSDFGRITSNLKTVANLTIDEFSTLISPPYVSTWTGAVFNGKLKGENWVKQQVFAVDFDNKKPDLIITLDEVLVRFKEHDIFPQMWYNTLSDTEALRKFRVVIFLDTPILCRDQRSIIAEGLISMFPEADTQCKYANSYFLGGKHAVVLNYQPTPAIHLISVMSIQLISKDGGRNRKVPAGLIDNFIKTGQKGTGLYYYNKKYRFSPENTNPNPSSRLGLDLIKINFKTARQRVKILDEFLKGVKLDHGQLFGLATQLLSIKGGMKLMKNTMIKHNADGKTKYSNEKFSFLIYIKKVHYPPIPVYAFSPYDEDNDIFDIVTATKRVRGSIEQIKPINRLPLSEAEKQFRTKFEEVMNDKTLGKIHLFKLPTAFGKTEKITSTLATIAAPTNKLKQEIGERMKIPVVVTPDPIQFEEETLNHKLEYYYSIGLPSKAMAVLHDIVNPINCKKYLKGDIEKAGKFLQLQNAAYHTQLSVLTTHARAIHSDYKSEILVFDEDPLNVLISIKQVRISELQKLDNQTKIWNTELQEMIEALKNTNVDEIILTPQIVSDATIEELMNKISNANYSTNIFELFNSMYIRRDPYDSDIINYVIKRDLPLNKVVVILSATLPLYIYQKLFGERLNVIDISDVEQVGEVIQFTKRSCSREGLKRYHPSISNSIGDKQVITFQTMKGCFNNPVNEMHFGNCSGYDSLKGQDIVVVGTPHRNNVEHLLIAKVLGIDFKEEDYKMTVKTIEYNVFRFDFNCYNHDELRNIQLALIESDLVQAVGRARTLREKATVEVYSNFPLRISNKFIF